MGDKVITDCEVSFVNMETGERIELGHCESISVGNIDSSELEKISCSNFHFSENKTVTISCKVVLFQNELGKLYYMKTHAKKKRVKKKYKKLYEERAIELCNSFIRGL